MNSYMNTVLNKLNQAVDVNHLIHYLPYLLCAVGVLTTKKSLVLLTYTVLKESQQSLTEVIICTSEYVCVCVSAPQLFAYIHICIHTCMHACMHVCMCM